MNTTATKTVAIELRGVTKAFGKIVANRNVDLTVYNGEILAILGENGSGKTSLMNTIAGIYYPDEGSIYIRGEEANITSPKDAFDYGIGMIHQHFKLIDVFSAVDNIILGVDRGKGVDRKAYTRDVMELATRYGFNLDPKKKIYDMSVSEKQTVEILKALYRGAEILILDEPTAVLTPQETTKLFDILRAMRDDNKTIIIITHKMHEVKSLSDRVAVLRKGEHIATVNTSETTELELAEMMIGKKLNLNINRSEPKNVSDRLVVSHISSLDHDGNKILKDISFTARAGEILGIAGIAGSGQRELLETIAGLHHIESGEIIFDRPKKNLPVSFYHKTPAQVVKMAREGKFHYVDGTAVDASKLSKRELFDKVKKGEVLFNDDEVINLRDRTPLQIREMGVRLSFVPEDRLGMGLVGNMNITDNMMLRSYRKGSTMFLDRKKPRDLAERIVESLSVVTPNTETAVRKLSGGNVQKVLVGREIASSPIVLMVAYPVRGLDINSSYMIYNLLNAQKEAGAAVIFVGEDLDVLVGLCDRIVVMNSGRITGEVDARTAEMEEIGLLMTKGETDSCGGES